MKVGEDSPLSNRREEKGKRAKKTSKGQSKASRIKKVDSAKEMGKRKRKYSPGLQRDLVPSGVRMSMQKGSKKL